MQVAVAALAGVASPGGFVVAGAQPRPGGQVRGIGKYPVTSAPISEKTAAAASGPMPGW